MIRVRWLLSAVLAAVVLAVFLPILDHEFVWDDEQYIVLNQEVTRGLSAAGFRWAFTTLYASNWHPLTWLSHMLDVELFGPGPLGPHLVNMLLHLTNTLLLFLLCRRLTGALWRSCLVAALFAIHPLHVESIAWAAERKDVLSSFLGLLAALAYRRYAARPGQRRYAAVFLLFAAACLAKPMLVTFPFLLALLDFWPLGRFGSGLRWRPFLEKLPLLALSGGVSIMTWLAQAGEAAVDPLPLGIRVSNALDSWVGYLLKFAWPADLAVFYPHPERVLPWWRLGGAALLLAGASAAAIRWRRRRPWLATGWFWYLGMLVPVIGLVQVGGQAMADRYLYLPLVGLAVLLAWSLEEVTKTLPRLRMPLTAVTASCLMALGVTSSIQVRHWQDAGTLFGHAIRVTAGNSTAHNHLGDYFERRHEPDRALEHYREALRLRPANITTLNNVGVLLSRQGRGAEALSYFETALRLDPNSGATQGNLARELASSGRAEEAIRHFEKALRLDPENAETQLELGKLFLSLGRAAAAQGPLTRAGEIYRRRLARNPGDGDAHLNLGAVLLWLRRPAAALEHFAEAVRLAPDSADARNNQAVALMELGRYREAAAALQEALRLDPSSGPVRLNLERVRVLMEKS